MTGVQTCALPIFHILRGLLKALDALDEVIALIRRSPDAEAARTGLMGMLDIDEAYEHMKDVRHARSGLVIVGCLPSIAVSLIPKVLLELRRDRPKLQIRVIEVHNEPLLEMLRMNAIELGLGTLMEETGDLRLRKLVDDEFVVVAPHSIATQLPSQMTWDDLASQDVILTSLGSTPREQFERSYSFKTKRIRPVYEVTHISTALAMG